MPTQVGLHCRARSWACPGQPALTCICRDGSQIGQQEQVRPPSSSQLAKRVSGPTSRLGTQLCCPPPPPGLCLAQPCGPQGELESPPAPSLPRNAATMGLSLSHLPHALVAAMPCLLQPAQCSDPAPPDQHPNRQPCTPALTASQSCVIPMPVPQCMAKSSEVACLA